MIYSHTQSTTRVITTLIASSLLLLLTACSNKADSKKTKESSKPAASESAQKPNPDWPSYVVAVKAEFKPFSFRGGDNAEVMGFDVDVINAIAKDQKFNVTYTTVPFDQLFAKLQRNNYDIAGGGNSITDERKKSMDFTDPYYTSYQAVIAKQDKPSITDFNQLKSYKVAVKHDTTSDRILRDSIKVNPDNIIDVASPYQAVERVMQDTVDYGMSDSPVLEYYKNHHADLNLKVYVDEAGAPDYYGFAVNKDREDDLLLKLNAGLTNIKADGTYQAINDKWFGGE